MPRQLFDLLLHQFTKHTNRMIPYSKEVNGNVFPDQISDLLNTVVTLKYRDYYKDTGSLRGVPARVKNMYGVEIDSRPSDDSDLMPLEPGPDDYEIFEVQTGDFTIVRADAVEPYRLIAVSTDYTRILVNSTRIINDGSYEFESIISVYPLQLNTFTGLEVYDQYMGKIDEIRGCTLRVDAGEPCYSVICEFLGDTGVIRFILGDEAFSKLYDYYDDGGDRDYDNRGAGEEKDPVDVDGSYPLFESEVFEDINGGHPDNWATLFSTESALSDNDIFKLRKSVIEGKTIYGTI